MSKLTVTVTEQVSNVAVTEQVIEVNEATGIGPQGIAGVVSATAPVTYNSGTQTVGINAGVANGVATLDSDGKVPTTQLPPLAVNDTFVVASQAAMLALTAQVGDIAVRTDVTKTFILTASPASTLGNWQEILTPPGVTSITATGALTGGTITSTGSIGLDQTTLSIATTQLTGKITDAQLNSGVTTTGEANKIVKVGSSGVAQFNTVGAGTFYFSPAGGISGQAGAGNQLMPLSDGGTLISSADSKKVTTSMIADNAITHAQIASGAVQESDILQSVLQNLIAANQSGVGAQIQPFNTFGIGANTNSPASGTINFTAFTMPYNLTVSQCSVANIVAVATVTNFKIGLYSWSRNGTNPSSNNRWTLLASYDPASADTTALATTGVITKTLTAVSGGTLSLTAGTRYAIGVVTQYSTGSPAFGAAGTFVALYGDSNKIDYPLYGYKGTSGALVDSGQTYVDQPTMTAGRNPIWFKLS